MSQNFGRVVGNIPTSLLFSKHGYRLWHLDHTSGTIEVDFGGGGDKYIFLGNTSDSVQKIFSNSVIFYSIDYSTF